MRPQQEASLAAAHRPEFIYFMISEHFLAQALPLGDPFLLCSFVSVWVFYFVLNELAIISTAPWDGSCCNFVGGFICLGRPFCFRKVFYEL